MTKRYNMTIVDKIYMSRIRWAAAREGSFLPAAEGTDNFPSGHFGNFFFFFFSLLLSLIIDQGGPNINRNL
jgi:hypothetical protein